ncbi:MAG: SusE domain-containing protein [Bacteroidota bacterium]|nr:SusE domain-containing protein [Bacteroidota bacterium]
MKTLLKKLFFIGVGVALFASCKKDQTMDYYNGGTAPVLTASVSGTIPLSNANQSNVEVVFSWTNPNYQFTTGLSSQNVSYLLEIDTLGANFTNPNRIATSISPDLGKSYVDAVLNAALTNQMSLVTGMKHTIQVRVTASINGVAATALVSNVLQFSVTPWSPPPTVNPPTSGKLFLVGSATAGGWGNPVPVPSQQFTQVSTTLYTITVPLTGGQEFLFIPVNGDWSHKFACNKSTSPPSGDAGGIFGYDWNDNFPGPTVTGTYKIDVNFQTGKYAITKQ